MVDNNWNPYTDNTDTIFFQYDYNNYLTYCHDNAKNGKISQSFYAFCSEKYQFRLQALQEDDGYFSEDDLLESKPKDWSTAAYWTRRILKTYHLNAIQFLNIVTKNGWNNNHGMIYDYIYFDGIYYRVNRFRSLLCQLMDPNDLRNIPHAMAFFKSLLKPECKNLCLLAINKRLLLYYAYRHNCVVTFEI